MSKVACLAHCNQAIVTLKFASDISLDEFRQDIINVSRQVFSHPSESETNDKDCQVKSCLIASYLRSTLNQSGAGHFSPLGAYHPESDKVLIMDVARFKYPPHWVPVPLLFEAMQHVDASAGKSRGYLIVQKSSSSVVDARESKDNCTSFCHNEVNQQSTAIEESNRPNAHIDSLASPGNVITDPLTNDSKIDTQTQSVLHDTAKVATTTLAEKETSKEIFKFSSFGSCKCKFCHQESKEIGGCTDGSSLSEVEVKRKKIE